MLRFDHLCYGQWHAMVNLSPRLPIKQQASGIMGTTEPLNDRTKEGNYAKTSEKRNLVTEKPDFEVVDEDYLI